MVRKSNNSLAILGVSMAEVRISWPQAPTEMLYSMRLGTKGSSMTTGSRAKRRGRTCSSSSSVVMRATPMELPRWTGLRMQGSGTEASAASRSARGRKRGGFGAAKLGVGQQGDVGGGEEALGGDLVHGDGGAHDAHAGIGDARGFKEALEMAVFAVAAMEGQQGDVEGNVGGVAEEFGLGRGSEGGLLAGGGVGADEGGEGCEGVGAGEVEGPLAELFACEPGAVGGDVDGDGGEAVAVERLQGLQAGDDADVVLGGDAAEQHGDGVLLGHDILYRGTGESPIMAAWTGSIRTGRISIR